MLAVDLPEHGLSKGDLGTVVLAHGDQGYEVEFTALDGEPLAVVSLPAGQVRPVGHREIAHARAVTIANMRGFVKGIDTAVDREADRV